MADDVNYSDSQGGTPSPMTSAADVLGGGESNPVNTAEQQEAQPKGQTATAPATAPATAQPTAQPTNEDQGFKAPVPQPQAPAPGRFAPEVQNALDTDAALKLHGAGTIFKFANALAGSPTETVVDDAGNRHVRPAPVSKGHLMMAILANALGGMAAGSQIKTRNPLGAVGAGAAATMQKNQEQDKEQQEQSQKDFSRRAGAIEANYRMLGNAIQVGRLQREDHDNMTKSYEGIIKDVDSETPELHVASHLSEEEAKDLNKFPIHEYIRVPDGSVPSLDNNGNPIYMTPDGKLVPKGTPGAYQTWNNTYSIISKDANAQMVEKEDGKIAKNDKGENKLQSWVERANYYGLPGFSDNNIDPLRKGQATPTVSAGLAARTHHQTVALDAMQSELTSFAKSFGTDKEGNPIVAPIDLRSVVKADPSMVKAIQQFQTTAGVSSQPDVQLSALASAAQKHPELQPYVGKIAALFGPKLDDYKQARLSREESAKAQATETGKLQAVTSPAGQAAAAQKTAAKVAEEQALIPVKAATAGAEAKARQVVADKQFGNANLSGQAYLDSLQPENKALLTAMGTGHMPPEKMSYLLARKPEVAAGLALAFPDFDSSKVPAYAATYKDFTSGKTSIVLNAGGTALLHLQELNNLNTAESRIPGTAAHSRYQNKVQTVSSELARFYAGGNQPGEKEIAAVKDSLNGFRREAAIQTQIGSMGDKLDQYEQTWRNAAPSSAYQAKMPGISEQAKNARAALDPEYAKRRASEQPQNAPPVSTLKEGVHTKFANGQVWTLQNGRQVQVQ